jgi:hypothetical protein
MANRARINEWYLKHADDLALRIRRLRWTQTWCPGFHDIEVSIRINGRTSLGRGFDQNEEIAFHKAGSEAIERHLCAYHGIGTEGTAIHIDRELAAEGARLELLERQLYSRRHFLPIDSISNNVTTFTTQASKSTTAANSYFNLFEIVGNSIGCSERVSFCTTREGYLGIACAASIEQACEKAVIEAIRNVAARNLLARQMPTEIESGLKKLTHSHTVTNHDIDSFNFEDLDIETALGITAPLFAVRASLDRALVAG